MSCVEEGFRLIGPPSECSLRSKARIDALFEDSRSICSSTFGGWYAEVTPVISRNPEDVGTEEQKRVNSAVQARIEAMFASVEAESGTPGECAAAILPVKYMGAAPVGGRVASVRGLQEPLRQLVERIERSVKAELEVSRRGLTFRTSEICEKNNPFRRIAVWSALKLRCKRLPSGEYHHAFLPLVGDQDQGQSSEDKHADLYRTMRGLKIETESYPPIFAVVMRRPGAARLLECHGFACETEEDAVVAAATLYRALLSDLEANRRRPRQTNGVGCISLASVASSVCESNVQFRKDRRVTSTARPAGLHPIRPPRTKKSSTPNSADESARSADLKVPRKKRNSEVNAEDILEARGRRRDTKGIAPTANPKVQNTTPEVTTNKYNITTSEQDWRNARNKQNKAEYIEQRVNNLANHKGSVITVGERNQSEKIYDKQESLSEIYDRCSNLYEKVPIKSKRDANQCTETIAVQNSLDNSVDQKEIVYELNRGSYDLNRNEPKSTDNRQLEKYSSKPETDGFYDKIEKISNCEVQESKKNGRTKSYEDHFRDADKIYSLEEEEEGDSKSDKRRSRSQSRNSENVYYARSTKDNSQKTQKSPAPLKQPVEQENSQSRRRLARVATMDKPLRKQPSNEHLSESALPEYSQPRVRKRSRAGSEPPVSRSEEAAKVRQENRLKRSQSDLDVDRGDLMTRVELPRRGSFLTSGSTRRPNHVNGGTPLGFTELFDEFRNQEGLTSVDDILAAIIDPEGMSFNDLKPLYKEFLLKLAATLTQDELYQRSASIMRRRRRPQRRRSTRRSCLLGRAIKRSVSRLKGGPTEFTSVIFPARRLNDSFGSSSSCDVKNAQRNRVLASRHGRRRPSWKMHKGGHCLTTSEDSDTCRRLTRSIGATANRSSSGYVSCSECSYDSESCTCVSADKCYCSLSRRVPVEPIPVNAVPCACDTDSCSESNKCYCARRPIQPTILEQLRQRGIVPAESTLSRGGSPDRARNSRASRGHASSRSLEFLKVETSPACGSSDNLALDYDLFNPGKKSQQSSGSEKILVVSARDTQGRLVYVGGTERDKKFCSRGNTNSDGHHEALSIKKSAEIAAVFGADAHRIYRRTSNASSLRSSISLEAGLGYLP